MNVNTEQLRKLIEKACIAVQNKNIRPIFDNVYLKINKHIQVISSSGEQQFMQNEALRSPKKEEASAAQDAGEEGSSTAKKTTSKAKEIIFCVNAKILQAALAHFYSEEIFLDYQESKNILKITSGTAKVELRTNPAEEFPIMNAENSTQICKFEMLSEKLLKMIREVQFAMATQPHFRNLNGVYFEIEDSTKSKKLSTLNLVATDTHRMAICSDELETKTEATSFVLPRKSVTLLQSVLAHYENQKVDIQLYEHFCLFTLGDMVFFSNLIEEIYPDYKRAIPQENQNELKLTRESFIVALNVVCSVLGNEKGIPVKLSLKPQSLMLSAATSLENISENELRLEYEGDSLEVSFNPSYLYNLLQNTEGDTIRLWFKDNKSSALATIDGEEDYKYVLMPISR